MTDSTNDRPIAADAPPVEDPDAVYLLSKDDIFGADDYVSRFVPCPEWAPKGHPAPERFGVYVRAITATERARWLDASVQIVNNQPKTNFLGGLMELVISATVTGPEKDAPRLFSKSDLTRLAAKNSRPLNRLGDVISELSGIGEEDMRLLGKAEGSADSTTQS